MIATFLPGFQSYWLSWPEAPSCYVFRVVSFAKLWHPFIHLALAATSHRDVDLKPLTYSL